MPISFTDKIIVMYIFVSVIETVVTLCDAIIDYGYHDSGLSHTQERFIANSSIL